VKLQAVAIAALLLSPTLRAGETPRVQTLKIGATAPDFSLPGVDGKTHSLEDFADSKLLVLVFTCNHCPTAQAYEERIKKLVVEYKPKGVAFVAISPNDPEAVRLNELGYTDLSDSLEEMKIRAKHKEFNFPYLYDGETQEASIAYGPVATPHVFLFDGDRKLRYTGRIDNAERESLVKTHDLRDTLDALLEGRPVPTETTRTFGCSIKWSWKRGSVAGSAPKPKEDDITLRSVGPEEIQKLRTEKSGRLRLINVWATWCGPCVAEFPELVKLQRMYGHRNFELVTLSGDYPDDKDKALAFLKRQGANVKNYMFDSTDRDKLMDAVDKEWKGALPHTLIVSPDGKVVYRYTGELDILEVRRTIVKHLGARK
jgi:peroxiredoxin